MTPFAPGVFVGEGDATRLLASRCGECGRLIYPASDICPDDGTVTEPVRLSPSASIYSVTTVRVRPPFGLPAPYVTAFVDVDKGPRIFALLDLAHAGAYRIGDRLRLTSGTLGIDLAGEPCVRPYFVPAAA